jgi:hypothetical protein
MAATSHAVATAAFVNIRDDTRISKGPPHLGPTDTYWRGRPSLLGLSTHCIGAPDHCQPPMASNSWSICRRIRAAWSTSSTPPASRPSSRRPARVPHTDRCDRRVEGTHQIVMVGSAPSFPQAERPHEGARYDGPNTRMEGRLVSMLRHLDLAATCISESTLVCAARQDVGVITSDDLHRLPGSGGGQIGSTHGVQGLPQRLCSSYAK